MKHFSYNHLQSVPLRLILIIPLLLQILAVVGLTGYLSLQHNYQTVNHVSNQLRSQITNRIQGYLQTYLATPSVINQTNLDAIKRNQLSLDLNQLSDSSKSYLWQQSQLFDAVSLIFFSSHQGGEFLGIARSTHQSSWELVIANQTTGYQNHYYHMSLEGKQGELLKQDTQPYDARLQPWYTAATNTGKLTWSDIVPAFNSGESAITASQPIYDQSNNLLGVIGVTLSLENLNTFLRELNVGESGQAFILEDSGKLVASSTPEPLFTKETNSQQIQQLPGSNSSNILVQGTVNYLTEQFGELNQIKDTQQLEFQFQGKRQFVQILPLSNALGLNWLIVTVIPETDLVGQANPYLSNLIWLCLAALGITIVTGIYASRPITQSILSFQQASEKLAVGKWNQTVAKQGIPEFNTLATAFNQMIQKLRESYRNLEQTNQQLQQTNQQLTKNLEEQTKELNTAKEMVEIANHTKSEFLANMSHELRTPLNGILGYAQILQHSETLNPKEKKGVDIIHQCSSHLLNLISDILDLSKIEARKLQLDPHPLHFPSLLQGVAEICHLKAEQKKLAFIYHRDPRLPCGIEADEKRLRQVLINLLGNAIKFTEQGGVTFKVEVIEDSTHELLTKAQVPYPIIKIRFQIEDTGVGITQEQLSTIFLPFEQVGETKKQTQGTGLGLAISKTIIEAMGSSIQVQSKPGQGSTFWFDLELPEVPEWAQLSRNIQAQTILGYQGKKRKILMVDDRWENRSVVVNLLEPIGFEIQQASNGQEALNQLVTFQPDLLIIDLVMPVMDGFEMLRQLPKFSPRQDFVVIVTSASVFEVDKTNSFNAGADDFLPKPVQTDLLLDMLQKYLHLEWVYQQEEPVDISEVEEPPPQTLSLDTQTKEILPPQDDDLTLLYELTRKGLIHKILKEVDRIEQADNQVVPFTQQLRELAEGFKIKQMRTFLEEYLEKK